MDYNTSYSWMQDNATKEDLDYFISIGSEDEAIEYAESIGAFDPIDDEIW